MKTQKKLILESLNNEYLKPLTRNELYRVQGGTAPRGGGITFGQDIKLGWNTTWTEDTYEVGYSTYEPGAGGMCDVAAKTDNKLRCDNC